MTEEEIKKWKEEIDGMTQTEMAKLHRFAPSGHPVFNRTLSLYEYFELGSKSLAASLQPSASISDGSERREGRND